MRNKYFFKKILYYNNYLRCLKSYIFWNMNIHGEDNSYKVITFIITTGSNVI